MEVAAGRRAQPMRKSPTSRATDDAPRGHGSHSQTRGTSRQAFAATAAEEEGSGGGGGGDAREDARAESAVIALNIRRRTPRRWRPESERLAKRRAPPLSQRRTRLASPVAEADSERASPRVEGDHIRG